MTHRAMVRSAMITMATPKSVNASVTKSPMVVVQAWLLGFFRCSAIEVTLLHPEGEGVHLDKDNRTQQGEQG